MAFTNLKAYFAGVERLRYSDDCLDAINSSKLW